MALATSVTFTRQERREPLVYLGETTSLLPSECDRCGKRHQGTCTATYHKDGTELGDPPKKDAPSKKSPQQRKMNNITIIG
eukprot:714595-Prorocentrum_minimum.AAC.1